MRHRVKRPTFSLLHASARPDKWKDAYRAWMESADLPHDIEYVLAVDLPQLSEFRNLPHDVGLVINQHRRCAVDAWNAAAYGAIGHVFVQVADDFFPPPKWDDALLSRLPDFGEHVIAVSEGRSDTLLCHSILTRAYYKRYAYLFWFEYDGMYADNEFTDVAYRDGVVIEARDLVFDHRHPAYGKRESDALDAVHQSQENYALGRRVYERRKAAGFPREATSGRER
jgi:hypothetical protein